MEQTEALHIFSILKGRYPEAREDGIPFASPFQILILTILSARTTDRQVEGISEILFQRYPAPDDLARAGQNAVEEIIRPTGYYHMKAQHIIAASRALVDNFHGEVPRTLPGLLTLPGVGRKTANIVLSRAFGRDEGIAVDTHVFRLSKRIGFSDGTTPEQVEQDLMNLFPRRVWGSINAVLIAHGRTICVARNPKCPVCPVRDSCRYYRSVKQG